jgi:hypothetical protein
MKLNERVAIVAMVVLLSIVNMLTTSCSASKTALKTPREEARAAVLLVTDGLALADTTCAALARTKGDAALANACAKAYDTGRSNLLNVAKLVDAYDMGKAGDVLCGTLYAANALSDMAEQIAGAGGKVPAAVDDALALGRKVGGCQ